MAEIAVFKAERDDGLAPRIRASGRLAFASPVKSSAKTATDSQLLALRRLSAERARGERGDFDLHSLDAILTTTGWNRNDDVFDGLETWVARKTPEDKPLNQDHDDGKIVGHIVGNWAMADDGKVIADDTVADDLPAKYHVVSGLVVYKCWQTPELQVRADKLLAEIGKGQWFVSMECLFSGFDYALQSEGGGCRTVARSEQTAHLTKHLRAYGGTGVVDGCRIGRLMRNICFSGLGFVRDPANPESIIFPNETEAFAAVYSPPTEKFPEIVQERDTAMTTEQQLAEAKAEIEKLKAGQTAAAAAEMKAQLEKAEASKAEADKLLAQASKAMADADAAAKAELAAKDAELAVAKATLEETAKSFAEVQGELKSLHAERILADRTAAVKKDLNLEDGPAKKFVEASASLDTASFSAQLAALASMAKPAPKGTPAPLPPKGTPAPIGAKAEVETDAEGEKVADASDIAGAKVEAEAVLATRISDGGVSDVQKAVANYFSA